MFSFFRKGPSPQSSRAIEQALVQEGLPSGMHVDRLRVLTRQGNYAGRSVRYFRAYDADQAAQAGLTVGAFSDLDDHPELIVGSGHVEREGGVSLTRHTSRTSDPSSTRSQADRASHIDDAHLVFWDAESSRTAAVQLSAAAASWQHAKSQEATEPTSPKDQ